MDRYYLNFAYQLAAQNEGNTSPNPSVGAVVVKDGTIAGWGYHRKAGEAHAEVVALDHAGSAAQGGTLYCSLEPCSHHGKTPPCVEKILSSGIKRVVFGCMDQNPLVRGKGRDFLRQKGIEAADIQDAVCEGFYRPFFHTFTMNRPYVILKAAMTANGVISPADRKSQWITNELTRKWVHYLRASCDGILIGANTLRVDHPKLTVRIPDFKRSPLRIIIDPQFRIHPGQSLLDSSDAPALICASNDAPPGADDWWQSLGIKTLRYDDVNDLLIQLSKLGLRKILVEGGRKVFTWFYTSEVIDEIILTVAPRLIGGSGSLFLLGGPDQSLEASQRMKVESVLELDGDWIVRMRRNHV